MSEVCHDVCVEPTLVPLTGEVFRAKSTLTCDEARADIRAAGFWTRAEDAYFDVRIFHPFASSYSSRDLADLFRQHENQKRGQYQERIVNVDGGSFTPLVFTTTGAAAPDSERCLRCLAGRLSQRDQRPYSSEMAWLRCRLSFALIRSAVMCVRGSRSRRGYPVGGDRLLASIGGRINAHDQ